MVIISKTLVIPECGVYIYTSRAALNGRYGIIIILWIGITNSRPA